MSQESHEQFREAILLAWQVFQDEIAKGNDRVTAEENAMRAVFPDENDISSLLATWKVKGLWPPEHPPFEHPGSYSTGRGASGAFGNQSEDMPSQWTDTILGLVRTTVNAAILDYHNVQGDQVTQEIDLIKARIVEILQSLEKVRSVDKEEIAAISRTSAMEALQEVLDELPASHGITTPQSSPAAAAEAGEPTSGRRKLEVTCNAVLLELLDQERKRWGFSVNQMLDHILLDYFGRAPDPPVPSITQRSDKTL